MTELAEPGVTIGGKSTAAAETQLANANKRTSDLMFGPQRIIFEEMVSAGNEMLDRARVEAHLFSEFVSKIAASHSVKDFKAMFEECGQHQIDFIRRDSDRLFKHGQQLIEATSKLFSSKSQN
jgi:hypothetical protein